MVLNNVINKGTRLLLHDPTPRLATKAERASMPKWRIMAREAP